jgi:glycosyltransferase involved in cell wall biosynthesis
MSGLDVYWVNQFATTPDQPGGSRHFDMARELLGRGHQARIVASDLTLTTRRYSRRRSAFDLRAIHEDVKGVPFTFLAAGSYQTNNWRRVASMLTFGALVFWHLVRVPVRPNTVFVGSSPHLVAAFGAWLAAAVRRVPFVFEVRDLWPESFVEVSGRERGIDVTAMRWIADHLYRRARAVVVLAAPNRARVIERGASEARVHVIPNGVDLAEFSAGAPELPTSIAVPGKFVFVYAGAHGPANGLDVAVRACAELARRGRDDIALALVGDGPVKSQLRELARDLGVTNVHFHEPVPKAAVPAVLSQADAGLMALAGADLFTYGVSPNKLFDYLAAGLPVVTNVPGLVGDIVNDAEVGLVVAADDPSALADGMVSIADSGQTGVAERGRAFIAEHYERRMLVDRLEEILTVAAGERRGRPSDAARTSRGDRRAS